MSVNQTTPVLKDSRQLVSCLTNLNPLEGTTGLANRSSNVILQLPFARGRRRTQHAWLKTGEHLRCYNSKHILGPKNRYCLFSKDFDITSIGNNSKCTPHTCALIEVSNFLLEMNSSSFRMNNHLKPLFLKYGEPLDPLNFLNPVSSLQLFPNAFWVTKTNIVYLPTLKSHPLENNQNAHLILAPSYKYPISCWNLILLP